MQALIYLNEFNYGVARRDNGDETSYAIIKGVDRRGRPITGLAHSRKADKLNEQVDESTPDNMDPGDVGMVLSVRGYYEDSPERDERYLVVKSFELVSGPTLELMHLRADAANAIERINAAPDNETALASARQALEAIADQTPANAVPEPPRSTATTEHQTKTPTNGSNATETNGPTEISEPRSRKQWTGAVTRDEPAFTGKPAPVDTGEKKDPPVDQASKTGHRETGGERKNGKHVNPQAAAGKAKPESKKTEKKKPTPPGLSMGMG